MSCQFEVDCRSRVCVDDVETTEVAFIESPRWLQKYPEEYLYAGPATSYATILRPFGLTSASMTPGSELRFNASSDFAEFE